MHLNGTRNYETYAYEETETQNTVTATNALGETSATVSDKNGNILSVIYNGAEQEQNTYNAHGKLLSRTDSVSGEAETFEYDAQNNLTRYSRGGNIEAYVYNADGGIKSREINGEVNQTYLYDYNPNAARTLNYIKLPSGLTYHPITDVNGRNTGKEIKSGAEKVMGEYITYRKVGDHATNMPSSVWYGNAINGVYAIKDNLKYAYDKSGNIQTVYRNGALEIRYSYDSLNRLIREDNKSLSRTWTFAYDRNGNVISKREYNFTLCSAEKLEELEETDLKQYAYDGDRLISYGEEAFAYDVIGNPVTYRGKTAVWSHGRQLQSYNGVTFAYDSAGRRISKGGITFTYDSTGKIIKQSNGLEFIYDSTGVSGVKYNGEHYLYRKDVQGNIIAILDLSGKAVVEYSYDAWGNHSVSGSNLSLGRLNPFRYRGYYYDGETGLYYLQTRYYDPELCRFITIDATEYIDPETINGLNLYAYCANNPVMNVDPTGTFVISLLAAAIIGGLIAGAVVGGIYGGVTAVANGQNVGWGILIGVLSGMALGAIAGFAGYCMAPLLAGGALVFGTSAGASFALGTGVALLGGFFVGGSTDLALQAVNNSGKKLDYGAAALSGLQTSIFTFFSSMFGSLGTGLLEGFSVGIGSGIIISAFNLLVDVIKNYFSEKKSPNQSLKAGYGI